MSLIRARYRAVNTIMNLPRGGGFVGLLDLFPNAAAAYSLRKLRAAYSGSAVRVRRSSDNTEQDIGFDANGDLDSTALLAFVNADVNQYTSDFSSTEDLNESNGTGAAAQSVGGVDDAYKFTLSGGAVSHFPRVLGALNTSDTFNISFDFYIPSSNSSCDGIQLYLLAGSPLYNTLDAWTSVSLTNVTSTSDQLRFYATDGGILTVDGDGDVFYLKNIVITQTTADGLVSTWYDQSLSNDATQSTAANQPKIVSGGSLVTDNGKPAVDFDGVDDFLARVFSLDVTLGYTNFYVCNVTSDATKYILASVKNSSNRYAIGVNDAGNYQSTKRTGGIVSDAATYSSGQVLLSDNSTPEIYLDGSVGVGSTGTLNNAFVSERLTIGENTGPGLGQSISGNLQEIILYNSDQSSNRTGIETNINTFYSIYP